MGRKSFKRCGGAELTGEACVTPAEREPSPFGVDDDLAGDERVLLVQEGCGGCHEALKELRPCIEAGSIRVVDLDSKEADPLLDQIMNRPDFEGPPQALVLRHGRVVSLPRAEEWAERCP